MISSIKISVDSYLLVEAFMPKQPSLLFFAEESLLIKKPSKGE